MFFYISKSLTHLCTSAMDYNYKYKIEVYVLCYFTIIFFPLIMFIPCRGVFNLRPFKSYITFSSFLSLMVTLFIPDGSNSLMLRNSFHTSADWYAANEPVGT